MHRINKQFTLSYLTGGSLTKLAYYSTVQHKVAKVRSFDHSAKVSLQVRVFSINPMITHNIKGLFGDKGDSVRKPNLMRKSCTQNKHFSG